MIGGDGPVHPGEGGREAAAARPVEPVEAGGAAGQDEDNDAAVPAPRCRRRSSSRRRWRRGADRRSASSPGTGSSSTTAGRRPLVPARRAWRRRGRAGRRRPGCGPARRRAGPPASYRAAAPGSPRRPPGGRLPAARSAGPRVVASCVVKRSKLPRARSSPPSVASCRALVGTVTCAATSRTRHPVQSGLDLPLVGRQALEQVGERGVRTRCSARPAPPPRWLPGRRRRDGSGLQPAAHLLRRRPAVHLVVAAVGLCRPLALCAEEHPEAEAVLAREVGGHRRAGGAPPWRVDAVLVLAEHVLEGFGP